MEEIAALMFRINDSSAVKMVAKIFSEMAENIYLTKRRRIPKDSNLRR
jgi:hypothetical protein